MTTNAHQPKDALLTAATALIWVILGVLAFAGVIVAICIPGVIFLGAEFVDAPELNPLTAETKTQICALLAGVAVLLYLGWRFFHSMLAIVRSVGEGDPFIPANADRLTAMGWIMLAINVAAIPLAALGVHLATLLGETEGSVEAGIDFGGIILVLTLFVLARVFRHGAAMRADLEGTV
jgi:hypothetical protein